MNIQVEKVNVIDVKEMWFSEVELDKLKLEKGAYYSMKVEMWEEFVYGIMKLRNVTFRTQ